MKPCEIICRKSHFKVICKKDYKTNIGPRRDENEEWKRLYTEKYHSLYRSPHIIRVFKFRTLRWPGHVARMEEGINTFKILTSKPTGNRILGRPRLDERTILKWIC
jgi:hypothetical protein